MVEAHSAVLLRHAGSMKVLWRTCAACGVVVVLVCWNRARV